MDERVNVAVQNNIAWCGPGVPMVEYEQAGDLSAALLAGFASIGPLCIYG
ncbi:hypothetical protein [Brevibacillus borstelensis]